MRRAAGDGLTAMICAALLVTAIADDFLSFPARSQLTSGANSTLAWLENVRGVDNVWSAAPPSWKPNKLTNFSADGMEITGLQFNPANGHVLFIRGPIAGANALAATEFTPTAATWAHDGKQAQLVANEPMVGLAPAGAPRSPCPSQSTCLLLARSEGTGTALWAQAVLLGASRHGASGRHAPPSPPPPSRLFGVAKGSIGGLAWRGDGAVLAFTNDRGSHGFLGLYAYGATAITWVAPSVDNDVSPTWGGTVDKGGGSVLAWLRARPPPDDDGYGAFEGGEGNRGPDFTVWVASVHASAASVDVQVADARAVYDDTKFGMPNFGYGRRPLVLGGNGDEVYVGSEALSGWLHLLAVNVSSGAREGCPGMHVGPGRPACVRSPRELRPGACEDREWLVADGFAYLSSNCGHIDGRDLERVRLADGMRQPIAAPGPNVVAGIGASESGPAGGVTLTADGHVAWLESSWASPAAVRLLPLAALRTGQPPSQTALTLTNDSVSSPGWSSAKLVQPRAITFPSVDGEFTVHAQLFEPKEPTGAGIVYTHGGSERQMFAAYHFSPTYAQQYAFVQWLVAEKGYTVLSPNYRSGVGYGAKFRLCEGCMTRGAREYLDVKSAGLVLGGQVKATPPLGAAAVDPKRIGIWGISYGGLNALQAVARDSHTVWAAAVSGAGIFNWISELRYSTDTAPHGVMGLDVQPPLPAYWRSLTTGPLPHLAGPGWAAHVQARLEAALASSPAAYTANLTAPLLLFQGDADQEVDFEECVGAVRAMRRLGLTPPEVLVVPDESHGFGAYSNQLISFERSAEFFAEHLGCKSLCARHTGARHVPSGFDTPHCVCVNEE